MSLVKLNIARGVTGTLPTSNYVDSGKIGLVVQVIDSTHDSFTSNSLTAASCTASITPSATSSKILVLYNAPVLMAGDANSYAEMRLFRDTTELRIFTDIGVYNALAQVATQTYHYDYLDSPSSTSSLTYSVKYAEHGSATLNINNLISKTSNIETVKDAALNISNIIVETATHKTTKDAMHKLLCVEVI